MQIKRKHDHILLVEDNKIYAELMEKMLLPLGFKTMLTYNGRDALRFLPVVRPALMLIDVRMPGMDGPDLCGYVRKCEDHDNMPIVFLTAYDDEQTFIRCIEAGGDDFILKSVSIKMLIGRLNYWLDYDTTGDNLSQARARRLAQLKLVSSSDKNV